MKRLLILLMAFLTVIPAAEAQFLKNLKKKVEEKVGDAVTKNIADKAASEADKSLNSLWEKQLKNSSVSIGSERVEPSEIPASYQFDWEYALNMETSEGEMEMVYHLKENSPHIGIKIPQTESMFTVLDNENKMTVMFMSSEDNKMVMATRFNIEETKTDEIESSYKDMELEKIGTKTILGYDCQGYRSENEDHEFIFYVAHDAGVDFGDLYKTSQKDIPEGFEEIWQKEGHGLMMEMQMNDKNNPERNVSMRCTGLEKEPLTIKTSDYQGIGG